MMAVLMSHNGKLGACSATYAPASTCPTDCKLQSCCYGRVGGTVGMVEHRIASELSGIGPDVLAELEASEVATLAHKVPKGHPLRLHVVGDCATPRRAAVLSGACANWPGPVWTYTHAWRTVPRESWGKVSVLASCESMWDAKQAITDGYAPAVVVPEHPADGKAYPGPHGLTVIPCPSQTRDIPCDRCRLCWRDAALLQRGAVIALAAHGAQRRKVLEVIQ